MDMIVDPAPSARVSLIRYGRKGIPMGTTGASRVIGLWAVLICMSLSGGCASTQETSTLQQSVSMLYDRVQALEKRVQGMDAQGSKSADLYSRMQEMQMRMGSLNGRIEELDHRIEQISRVSAASPPHSQAQMEPQGSSTVVSLPPGPGPSPSSSVSVAPSSPQTPPFKGVPGSEPPGGRTAEAESPEKAHFDRASQLFQQGQYERARKEFQSFVSKYPKSPMADNALYSAGECYLSEKRYQDAIEVFQQVLDRYPKGDRVPHALLKQGTAFQQLGDNTAARILYERLVEKYPDSSQAQIAQKKLKQMP